MVILFLDGKKISSRHGFIKALSYYENLLNILKDIRSSTFDPINHEAYTAFVGDGNRQTEQVLLLT